MEAYINHKHYYCFTANMLIIHAITSMCLCTFAIWGMSRAARKISELKRDLQAAEKRAEEVVAELMQATLAKEASDKETWEKEALLARFDAENEDAGEVVWEPSWTHR